MAKILDSSNSFFLLHPPVIAVSFGYAQLVSPFRQSGIGIILAQQDAVFSPGGKHAVRLVNAFRHQVVYQHADVGLVSFQFKRSVFGDIVAVYLTVSAAVSASVRTASHQRGIDAGYRSLAASLLVAGSAVHLSSHEETADNFRFQRVAKLRGVKEIILYRIAWTVHAHISQCRYLSQRFYLHVHGQRRREAVQVHLVGIFAFRFEK